MQLRQLVPLGSLLLAISAPLSAQCSRDAFRDVPREHWAYTALGQTERSGVHTGYPEGTFRGKRLLTRYEIAVAVQRAAEALLRTEAVAAAGAEGALRTTAVGKLNLPTPWRSPELPRLIAEFTPELKLLGADPDQLRRQIERRLPPEQVDRVNPAAPRSKDYEKGVRLAREEWEKGETVLYSGGLSPSLTIDQQLGIPLYFAYGCIATPETLDLARGHNDEVHRLITERGLPVNNRVRWMSEILEPQQLWADPKQARTSARYGGPAVTSPDGKVTLRLKTEQGEQPPRLEISAKGGKLVQRDIYRLDRRSPMVTALWGSPDSHLLYLRYQEGEMGRAAEVLEVVDTALGRTLNRIYRPDPVTPKS